MPSRLRRHDEFGHIHFVTVSCVRRLRFFQHESVRAAFVSAMKAVREKHGVRWLGYVVMPEHVHLLVLPQRVGAAQPVPMAVLMHDLKQWSGHAGKEAMRDVWRLRRSLGTRALDGWATGPDPKPFWKPRGYDFSVLREDRVLGKLHYMHANPVRRGLVARPDEWRWSSFRFYELRDQSSLAMDWDGAFPIVM
jgi:putative transposase